MASEISRDWADDDEGDVRMRVLYVRLDWDKVSESSAVQLNSVRCEISSWAFPQKPDMEISGRCVLTKLKLTGSKLADSGGCGWSSMWYVRDEMR